LSEETLGNNYSYSDDAVSPGEHDEILHNLIFFALEKSGSPKIPEFKRPWCGWFQVAGESSG
jgi:hypothetical protein